MTPETIKQLQASLGIPTTGVFDAATSGAFASAIQRAASANPDIQEYAGANDVAAIVNAFQTGDWSSVTSLTGKPFTDQQQQAAVSAASQALGPAYEAEKSNDTAAVQDTLEKNAQDLSTFERDQAAQFGKDKNALDQNAADQGVLFSGSRLQKQNDLRTTYANADADKRRAATQAATTAARGYQYAYGNDATKGLSSYYTLPGATSYDAGVAGGKVKPSGTLSAVYDPNKYNFQGTKPVAQSAAVQTRAATLLSNRANKLSLSGVGAKF